jgi:hypothetical protein
MELLSELAKLEILIKVILIIGIYAIITSCTCGLILVLDIFIFGVCSDWEVFPFLQGVSAFINWIFPLLEILFGLLLVILIANLEKCDVLHNRTRNTNHYLLGNGRIFIF